MKIIFKCKYWYLYYIGECPVCGRDASYKVRQYTPKPIDLEKRYIQLSYNQTYCGCL